MAIDERRAQQFHDLCIECPVACFALVVEDEGTDDEWRVVKPIMLAPDSQHFTTPEEFDSDDRDVILILGPGESTSEEWVQTRVTEGVTARELAVLNEDGSVFVVGGGDEIMRGPETDAGQLTARGRWLKGGPLV